MTAQAVALGLRTKYPLQAAKAKAFRKWMEAWAMGTKPKGSERYLFWTAVCIGLDTEATYA